MNSNPMIQPLEQSTSLTRFNPPGLSSLSYRGGQYQLVLQRLLNLLPHQKQNATTPGQLAANPLANLNLYTENDWSIALLHAWAAVIDVLTFYQERIINEGYLRTASERRSILELVRSIGYELYPGAAASTHLAFTVMASKDEPPRQVTIPKGYAVQSSPLPGQLPQTFETSNEFIARSEWNTLTPNSSPLQYSPQDIQPETTSLRLEGTATDLQPGSRILLLEEPDPQFSQQNWQLAALSSVKPDPVHGFTEIVWNSSSVFRRSDRPLKNPSLFTFKQRSSLFGYAQSALFTTHSADHAWDPAAIGLPLAPVRALIRSGTTLFAATQKDIYRSSDSGATWFPARGILEQKDIHALTSAGGDLFAGSADGSIYLSKDGGSTWVAPGADTPIPPPYGLGKLLPRGRITMPKTGIRSLFTAPRGKTIQLFAATDNGVLRSPDQGKTWETKNDDLPETDSKTGLSATVAWALAVQQSGRRSTIFAGTEAGVFRIRDYTGLGPFLLISLIVLLIYQAFSPPPEGASLFQRLMSFLTTLIAFLSNLLTGLIAQLQNLLNGLFQQPPNLNDTLAPLLEKFFHSLQAPLDMLAETGIQLPPSIGFLNPYLHFVLDFLLVYLSLAGIRWLIGRARQYLITRPLVNLGIPVHALVAAADGTLFAGTEQGVFRSNDSLEGNFLQRLGRIATRLLLGDFSRRWQLLDQGLTSKDIRALALEADGSLLAGTQEGTVLRLVVQGSTWQLFGGVPPLKSVRAVAVTPDAYFAAGIPLESPPEKLWSPFQLRQNLVVLNARYPNISPGSLLLLSQESGAQNCDLFQVQEAESIDSHDALQPVKVTSLKVSTHLSKHSDSANGLQGFERSACTVLAQSEKLNFYNDQPVGSQDYIQLDRYVPGLERGQLLIITGKRARARLLPNAPVGMRLHSLDNLSQMLMHPGERFQMAAPPLPIPGVSDMHWLLKNREGFVGLIETSPDNLAIEPAGEEDETVSELVMIKDLETPDTRKTTLIFERPLENIYDRSTVVILGNIVSATHGRTVAGELLGDSEGMKDNQHFTLSEGPLTYLSAATESGIRSTLEVTVNGVVWEEVSTLLHQARGERAYMLRQDEHGNTTLIFGDSKHGAGLPIGTQQILATYRKGIGREGNLAASQLNLLQVVLQDLKSVTNPLPACGGTEPEEMNQARQNAPRQVRAMRRIVSLKDYHDFAINFTGISKARVRELTLGDQKIVHLSVAGSNGAQILTDSDLYQNLVKAIDTCSIVPKPPVQVASFSPVYFNVKARLWLKPGFQASKNLILAESENALTRAFAFDQRDFDQEVSESEILSVLQNVHGVMAVVLDQLYFHGETPGLNSLLQVEPARIEAARILPAQILMINSQSENGIRLELVQ